jgi:hypothetical protein
VVVVRIIAWLLLAGAVFAGGLDGLSFLETGAYSPIPLGKVWATIHADSLLKIEPVIADLAGPTFWGEAVQAPASLVAALGGLLLTAIARTRTPRRRRRPEWR